MIGVNVLFIRKRRLKGSVLKCAEVHVFITNPDGWYVCNNRVCDDDVSWHMIYTEHREYVRIYIVMTCLGI